MPGFTVPRTLTGDQSEQWDAIRRLHAAGTRVAQGPIWLPSDGYDPDVFTISGAGDLDHTLTYLPLGLDRVTLNNTPLAYTTDFTIDWPTGVVSLVNAPTTGDVLEVWYVTTGELIAASLPPEGGTPPTFNALTGSAAHAFGPGTSVTSGSFTPTGNALIIVAAKIDAGAAPGTPTISDTFGGLTWTRVGTTPQFSSNTGVYEDVELFYATAPSSPGTHTVTVTWTGTRVNTDTMCVIAAEAVGWGGTIGTTGQNSALSAGNVTVTLGATPAADSGVVTVCGTDGPPTSLPAPTGYTIVTQMNESTNATVCLAIAAISGGAGNTVPWTSSPAAYCTQAAAIEVAADPG